MRLAYIDTSCLVAIAFGEAGVRSVPRNEAKWIKPRAESR
jgi:hypothetical protein